MITIISTEELEHTTDMVMKWLESMHADCVRVNSQDLVGTDLTMSLEEGQEPCLSMELATSRLHGKHVGSVWFRRTSPIPMSEGYAEWLKPWIHRQMKVEDRNLKHAWYSMFSEASWLGSPETASPNKWNTLQLARSVGLKTPPSLTTTAKASLVAFKGRHGKIIAKPLGETRPLNVDEDVYILYTQLVDDSLMETLPERFYPLFCQAYIEKAYELRIFYLDGTCYSMAIFSQASRQTSIDFRRYNYKKPNRNVPYRLPAEIAQKIDCLMKLMNLNTGSLDLIKTPGGEFYFLEVNPVGQFGMVSNPCNYYLEEKVARWLIEEDQT